MKITKDQIKLYYKNKDWKKLALIKQYYINNYKWKNFMIKIRKYYTDLSKGYCDINPEVYIISKDYLNDITKYLLRYDLILLN